MAKIEKYTLKNGQTRYKIKVYLGVDNKTGLEKRTTLRFDTYKEAKETLASINFKRSKGELSFSDHSEVSLTLEEVYQKWLPIYHGLVQESTFDKTVRIFEGHILPHLGKYKVNQISVDDCQTALNIWRKKLRRFRMVKNYASKLLDFAQMRGYITSNPMKLVLTPPTRLSKTVENKDNFYTKEEFKLFIDKLRNLKNLKRKAYFTLLANTGLRRSEALALQWGDIDFENYTVEINKALKYGNSSGLFIGPTKNYTNRTVTIDTHTISVLNKWQQVQKEELKLNNLKHNHLKQLIFNNTQNSYINPNQPSRWLKEFLSSNNLRLISNHGLRHTHCTLLFQAGVDPKTIQQRLGHNDIQTTLNIYTHFSKENIQNAPSRLETYLEN